ncbi:MAG: ABC transporter ATP-binding protein [Candidatus Cloacimonadia bacterium]
MLLEAKNIWKSYKEGVEQRELVVLKGLHIEVEKGETLAITGASGSGKSTLLHILATLDRPDRGEIIFYDNENSKQSGENRILLNHLSEIEQARFRNKKIGFVFQFHHLLPDFTVIENVALPKLIAGSSVTASMDSAEKILADLDILARKDYYPNQLSGGEQQRVAVARALINNPNIIFADEPTGNLDKTHSEELLNLLWSLNEKFDTTIFIVTHDENLAQQNKKVYHLSDGILEREK